MFKAQIDPGGNNTRCEDPSRDFNGDFGFDLAGPFVENKEVNGCEGIDGVDSDGNEERDPEVSVCEICEATCSFEII
jgi:hypothetical protein